MNIKMIRMMLIASLYVLPSLSFATSGGLNKNGCHNSKKAGYHCHRAN